jgi:hypothetical protein
MYYKLQEEALLALSGGLVSEDDYDKYRHLFLQHGTV